MKGGILNEGFEDEVRRLVKRVLSGHGIRIVGLAAALTTPTDNLSKQQVGMWLRGKTGLGRARFDRVVKWLAQNGHEIIVPEYKEKEES